MTSFVVPDGGALAKAKEIAATVAENGPLAFAQKRKPEFTGK